jgi:hypothetical protein
MKNVNLTRETHVFVSWRRHSALQSGEPREFSYTPGGILSFAAARRRNARRVRKMTDRARLPHNQTQIPTTASPP